MNRDQTIELEVPFLMKRFGEKLFAKGASREIMNACSEIGMELEGCIEVGSKAMTDIAEEIGL